MPPPYRHQAHLAPSTSTWSLNNQHQKISRITSFMDVIVGSVQSEASSFVHFMHKADICQIFSFVYSKEIVDNFVNFP